MCNNLVRSTERDTVAQSQQGDKHQQHISAILIKWVHNADKSGATQPCTQKHGMYSHGVAATGKLTFMAYLCTVL